MKKIPMKGQLSISLLVILLIALGVNQLFSGPHTPQDCINEISFSPLDPPNIKRKEKDIITLEVNNITLYAYQSIDKDVRIMQLSKKENMLGITKYSFIEGVTYWNKDWKELSSLPYLSHDKSFVFWISKEEDIPPEDTSLIRFVKSYPVEVDDGTYFFNISSDKEFT